VNDVTQTFYYRHATIIVYNDRYYNVKLIKIDFVNQNSFESILYNFKIRMTMKIISSKKIYQTYSGERGKNIQRGEGID